MPTSWSSTRPSARSYALTGAISSRDTVWEENGLRAAMKRRIWEFVLRKDLTWADNVLLLPQPHCYLSSRKKQRLQDSINSLFFHLVQKKKKNSKHQMFSLQYSTWSNFLISILQCYIICASSENKLFNSGSHQIIVKLWIWLNCYFLCEMCVNPYLNGISSKFFII